MCVCMCVCVCVCVLMSTIFNSGHGIICELCIYAAFSNLQMMQCKQKCEHENEKTQTIHNEI